MYNKGKRGQTMNEINKKIMLNNIEILQMMKKINENLRKESESNNWGHVGDSAHIKECLKEICDFMRV